MVGNEEDAIDLIVLFEDATDLIVLFEQGCRLSYASCLILAGCPSARSSGPALIHQTPENKKPNTHRRNKFSNLSSSNVLCMSVNP